MRRRYREGKTVSPFRRSWSVEGLRRWAPDLIGTTLIDTLGGFGPLAVMAGITVLWVVLTRPIHNAAVVIIMTPIAINAASMMDAKIVPGRGLALE